jgi:hypothetical protein
MNSDSVPPISSEWEELLKNTPELTTYIMDALMLTPFDTRRKIIDGKPQKVVQLFSLQKSIDNNADPNKKGLTYLAMRSIHYWKTIYERAIQNPKEIEAKKGKYIARHMFDSVLEDFHIEIQNLQNVMYSKNVVPKEEYETLKKECYDWRIKYEKLDANYNRDIERERDNAKKSADAECERIQRIADFYKNECHKLGKINSNKEH